MELGHPFKNFSHSWNFLAYWIALNSLSCLKKTLKMKKFWSILDFVIGLFSSRLELLIWFAPSNSLRRIFIVYLIFSETFWKIMMDLVCLNNAIVTHLESHFILLKAHSFSFWKEYGILIEVFYPFIHWTSLRWTADSYLLRFKVMNLKNRIHEWNKFFILKYFFILNLFAKSGSNSNFKIRNPTFWKYWILLLLIKWNLKRRISGFALWKEMLSFS